MTAQEGRFAEAECLAGEVDTVPVPTIVVEAIAGTEPAAATATGDPDGETEPALLLPPPEKPCKAAA
jgi:hypothetical protein